MLQSPYQVGGSLTTDHPTYVERQADQDLYQALKQGKFCYVLNARQMGKSSLMVRTQHRLKQEGFCCASVDLSVIGSEDITPLQWYKGIVTSLCLELNLLDKFNLKAWWKEQEELSFIQRFSQFIEKLITDYFPDKHLLIFIDEVDSILHLDFSVDDFFALIRYFYNQRALHSHYQRVTFAIFGVAIPSDLIQDKTRTPFNIGNAIELNGFQWHEVQPLAASFNSSIGNSEAILRAILNWTNGQPFLTQKLCDLVIKSTFNTRRNSNLTEAEWVQQLVQLNIIQNWETQDQPEHLKTIRDRLLSQPERRGRILGLYQKIIQSLYDSQKIKSDNSIEVLELLLSGLVVKEQGNLIIKNRIYAGVFNQNWIQNQLNQIRPYSQNLEAWKRSNYQDESRLLRGKALNEAQIWADGKSLTDLDYQFLAASQKYEDQAIRKNLELEKTKAMKARLIAEKNKLLQEKKAAQVQKFFLKRIRQEEDIRLSQENEQLLQKQKNIQLQRILLIGTTSTLGITMILGGMLFWQNRNIVRSQQQAIRYEVKTLVADSKSFFVSQNYLEALLSALKATQKLKTLKTENTLLEKQVKSVLDQGIFNADQYNEFWGHDREILALTFSQKGENFKTLISGSSDQRIRLWNTQGQLLRNLVQEEELQTIAFSPDGEYFAVGYQNNQIKLYDQNGILFRTFFAKKNNVQRVILSDHQYLLAAVSGGDILQIWTKIGDLLTTISSNQGMIYCLAFSPQGDILASGGEDHQVKLWSQNGELLAILPDYLPPHSTAQQTIAFSPNGQQIAVKSTHGKLKLYNTQGVLLKTLETHQSAISSIAFSPNGKTLAIAGIGGTIQLWNIDGYLLKTLTNKSQSIQALAFSHDSQTLASGGADGTLHLWRLNHPFQTTFSSPSDPIQTLKFITDDQFVTYGHHQLIHQWQGSQLIRRLSLPDNLTDLDPKKQYLRQFIAQADPLFAHEQLDETLLNSIQLKMSQLQGIAVDPQGDFIVVHHSQNQIQIWDLQGRLIQSFSPKKLQISQIQLSPKGQFVALSNDREIEVWTITGQFYGKLIHPNGKIHAWHFSPDQATLITINATGQIQFWSLQGQLRHSIQTNIRQIQGFAVSPQGDLMAVIDARQSNQVQLWDQQGQLLQTLHAPQTQLRLIVFSPRGDGLVAVDAHDQVILWHLKSILRANLVQFACDWVEDYRNSDLNCPTLDLEFCHNCEQDSNSVRNSIP